MIMSQLFGQEKSEYVRSLFDAIARRYDLMNVIMTFGLVSRWQRYAVSKLGLKPGAEAIDVCCGTAELAILMKTAAGPQGRIWGLDFSSDMLAVADAKIARLGLANDIHLVQGDALALPFPDNNFDGAISGFALRNVIDIPKTIAEMTRVVKPGGRVVTLEMSKPKTPLLREGHHFYLYHVVPVIGWLIGRREKIAGRQRAYTYLPHSLTRFVDQEELAAIFRDAGLVDVHYQSLGLGAVTVHWGTKPNLEAGNQRFEISNLQSPTSNL